MTDTEVLPWEREDAGPAGAGEDALGLPGADTLASILDEQGRFDGDVEADPEVHAGEFGKTALEGRAEIPSLALLHHRRRVLARALAPLAALFEGGQNPPAEAKRKQHRHIRATQIAHEQGLTGEKMEAKLERLANADPQHVAFCDQLEALRVQYYLGKVALMELNEEIRDREQSLLAYNAELRAGIRGGGQV